MVFCSRSVRIQPSKCIKSVFEARNSCTLSSVQLVRKEQCQKIQMCFWDSLGSSTFQSHVCLSNVVFCNGLSFGRFTQSAGAPLDAKSLGSISFRFAFCAS